VIEGVRVEQVEPLSLAAVAARTPQARLSATIFELLDQVWPVVRGQGVRTGHNVVVYGGVDRGELSIQVGVETFSDFVDQGEVRQAATPAGLVAAIAYFGDYRLLSEAYEELDRWCATNGRPPSGPSWEVYGDWEDDPNKRRTDIYRLLEGR
jgi:hypothetical protein